MWWDPNSNFFLGVPRAIANSPQTSVSTSLQLPPSLIHLIFQISLHTNFMAILFYQDVIIKNLEINVSIQHFFPFSAPVGRKVLEFLLALWALLKAY